MSLLLRSRRIQLSSLKSFVPPARTRSQSTRRSTPLRTFAFYFGTTLILSSGALLWILRRNELLWVNGDSMSPLLSPTFSTTGSRDLILVKRNVRLNDAWMYKYDGETHERLVDEHGNERRLKTGTSELKRGMVVAFYTPHKPDRVAVKRVVAMDGDTVTPLERKGGFEPPRQITVPYNHVWVEGDNEDKSMDSNDYGPVSKSLIEGVVTRVMFPLARRGEINWQEHWDNGRRWSHRVTPPRYEMGTPVEWEL